MAVNSYREDEEVKVTSKMATVRRLLGYLKRYKKQVVGVIFAMLVAVAISLANPLIIESAIDTYLPRHDLHGLMKLGVLALIINVVYVVMVKIRMYVMSIVSNSILRDIRQELYEHIQTLAFTFFDGRPHRQDSGADYGRRELPEADFHQLRHHADSRLLHDYRRGRHHAGEKLAAGAGDAVRPAADDAGGVVFEQGVPQALAGVPQEGVQPERLRPRGHLRHERGAELHR